MVFCMVDDALSLRSVGMAVGLTNLRPFAVAQQAQVGRGVRGAQSKKCGQLSKMHIGRYDPPNDRWISGAVRSPLDR